MLKVQIIIILEKDIQFLRGTNLIVLLYLVDTRHSGEYSMILQATSGQTRYTSGPFLCRTQFQPRR